MTNEKTKFIGIRLASMFFDHIIMSLAIGLIIGVFIFADYYLKGSTNMTSTPKWFINTTLIFAPLIFSSYFNKDAILGKSPAKRILGLIVLDNNTNKIASPLQCLIRNITLFIWPIEVAYSLFSPERRIGDFIAGTKVVSNKNKVKAELNLKATIFAWIIGALLFALIFSLVYLF